MPLQHSNATLVGTAGGTFLSILPNLHSEDILKTIILATLGAIVSFLISLLLKILIKKHKK
jgi:mannitol-specific phosphotransferase system IIBC component